MAGCAVALASCTQTDVIEEGVQSSAIGFENAVNKQSPVKRGQQIFWAIELMVDCGYQSLLQRRFI